MSKNAAALVCALLLAAPMANCVASTSDQDGADEQDFIYVDNSDVEASVADFKRWYRAEFGEERYRAEFGADPK